MKTQFISLENKTLSILKSKIQNLFFSRPILKKYTSSGTIEDIVNFEIKHAHRIYNIPFNMVGRVHGEKLLHNHISDAINCLVLNSSSKAFAEILIPTPSGNSIENLAESDISVCIGSNASEIANAIIQISSQFEVDDSRSYEFTLIRSGIMGVKAVWLQSQSAGDDIVIPLRSASRRLEIGKAYTIFDFENVIINDVNNRVC
jgi:hypothetical protein